MMKEATQSCYNEASDEVKAVVQAELLKIRAETQSAREELKKARLETKDINPVALQQWVRWCITYHSPLSLMHQSSAINNFPQELSATMKEWHQRTGLIFSVNFGGCNPGEKGAIMVGQWVQCVLGPTMRLTVW
jgi:hypothetical protein